MREFPSQLALAAVQVVDHRDSSSLFHAFVAEAMKHNEKYFEAEIAKLDQWVEDLISSVERKIRTIDLELKAAKREAQLAGDLASNLELQNSARILEIQRNDKRKNLFEAQDEIDLKKDRILEETAEKLKQQLAEQEIFTIRWRVM